MGAQRRRPPQIAHPQPPLSLTSSALGRPPLRRLKQTLSSGSEDDNSKSRPSRMNPRPRAQRLPLQHQLLLVPQTGSAVGCYMKKSGARTPWQRGAERSIQVYARVKPDPTACNASHRGVPRAGGTTRVRQPAPSGYLPNTSCPAATLRQAVIASSLPRSSLPTRVRTPMRSHFTAQAVLAQISPCPILPAPHRASPPLPPLCHPAPSPPLVRVSGVPSRTPCQRS